MRLHAVSGVDLTQGEHSKQIHVKLLVANLRNEPVTFEFLPRLLLTWPSSSDRSRHISLSITNSGTDFPLIVEPKTTRVVDCVGDIRGRLSVESIQAATSSIEWRYYDPALDRYTPLRISVKQIFVMPSTAPSGSSSAAPSTKT
jgi:hypothetical protein